MYTSIQHSTCLWEANNQPKEVHEKISMGVCLVCFREYENGKRNKFWFSRFNQSTQKEHMNG